MQEYIEEQYITTRVQLIDEIESYLKAVENKKLSDLISNHSENFYQQYLMLIRQFYDLVKHTLLLKQLEPEWIYSCEIDDTGASLNLCHISDLTVNEEDMITSVCINEEFQLIKVNTKLLTVEEYANIYKVSVGTVRQWIRRGKIRRAIKAGSEWRIPELAEPYGRGYSTGIYNCTRNIENIPEIYSFISSAYRIEIEQIDYDTYEIRCDIRGNDEDVYIKMNGKEREKFELFLISNSDIEANRDFLETIVQINIAYS